jgi:hypothetical protein
MKLDLVLENSFLKVTVDEARQASELLRLRTKKAPDE